MKHTFIAFCLAFAFGCGIANQAPVQSVHHASVDAHLQTGGEVYIYVDAEQDILQLSEDLAKVAQSAELDRPITKEDVQRIFRTSGMGNFQAIGLSSYRKDENSFHNRSFVQFSGPRDGIMQMLGGEPHEFEAHKLAPANADLVIEQDLHIQKAYQSVFETIESFDADIANNIRKQLKKLLPVFNHTGEEILSKLNTKVMIFASVDKTREISLEQFGYNIVMPHIELALSIDGLGSIFDKLRETLGNSPFFTPSEQGDIQTMTANMPLVGAFQHYKPLLAKKGDRIWLASTPVYFDSIMAEKGEFAASQAWQDASDGLPSTMGELHLGNGLSFVSPSVGEQLEKIVQQLPEDEGRDAISIGLGYLFPKSSDGSYSASAMVQTNMNDGIAWRSNSATSHKSTMSAMVYVNPATFGIIAAIAIPAFIKYVRRAKVNEIRSMQRQLTIGIQQSFLKTKRLPPQTEWSSMPSHARSGDWQNLGVSEELIHYRYRIVRPDEHQVIIEAEGDLDSDGRKSVFRTRLKVENDRLVEVFPTEVHDELE